MDERQDSKTKDAAETRRVAETDKSHDDHPVDSRDETRSLSGKPRSTPEYHDSWYRNETMRDEVRATVEGQVAWLREIDDKAMRTLRFNAVLLGLVVPVFSFAIEFELVSDVQAFHTPYTALGIATLVASTALAGLTYTSSSIEAGVSSDDVRAAQRRELTDEEVHDVLLTSYVQWIRSNQKTVRWNTVLVTLTVILTIVAFVSLTLGLTSAILGTVPEVVTYSAYFGLLVVAIASQVV